MNARLKPKRRDGLQRQSQIMHKTLDIFVKRGYVGTSVNDIIEMSGIARGTFYAHFKSKEDILEKIIDNNLEMLYQALSVLDISKPEPAEELKKLYLTVSGYLANNDRVRNFVSLMLREISCLNSQFFEKINNFYNKIIMMSADYIQKAQAAGTVVPEIDPLVTAFCIVGSVKEILFHWIVLNENIDMEKAIASTVDIFFKGMFVPQNKA